MGLGIEEWWWKRKRLTVRREIREMWHRHRHRHQFYVLCDVGAIPNRSQNVQVIANCFTTIHCHNENICYVSYLYYSKASTVRKYLRRVFLSNISDLKCPLQALIRSINKNLTNYQLCVTELFFKSSACPKKFPVLYGKWKLITVYETSSHWTQSCARWIQSTFSNPISLISVPIVFSHLRQWHFFQVARLNYCTN